MFGFVVLSKDNSTKEERELYKGHYCGLCHVLSEKYGKKGMMALSYDMVFLEMVLSDLYDEAKTEGTETCSLHPFKSHRYIHSKSSSYASDMQMLLYYYSLLDHVHDEGKGAKKAESYKERADELESIYPRQAKAIKEGLAEITEREERNDRNVGEMSLLFGKILGEVFVSDDEDFFAPSLRMLGCGLGRFIYILDAWTDKEKDYRKGLYNPLDRNCSKEEAESLLLDAAADATEAFERLPLDEHISILRNILYSGIWTRFKAGKKDE